MVNHYEACLCMTMLLYICITLLYIVIDQQMFSSVAAMEYT